MTFGDYLRREREARGWTQPQAAEKIGIEQSYLSKLETGKATPSEEMFARLVTAYEIDMEALGQRISDSELGKLKEIAVIRELITGRLRAGETMRRRWLMASLLMLVVGTAIMSFTITSVKYPADLWVYASKGIILDGESDFIFEDIGFRGRKINRVPNPNFCADPNPEKACELEPFREVEDPIMQRITLDYMTLDHYQGDRFTRQMAGGRRVYEQVEMTHARPLINTHAGHALGLALMVAGLAGFYISRRW